MPSRSPSPSPAAPPSRTIASRIVVVRGQRVILDADLAELYGVPTRRLNEQVRRNAERFPEDFCFQLSADEAAVLRSQIATSSSEGHGWGGRRYLPYAFTEHGAIMAANVLNSPRAVAMSVQVVRTFVRLREVIASHKDLAKRLGELEAKYDKQFKVVFDAIRALMAPPEAKPKRKIGFV